MKHLGRRLRLRALHTVDKPGGQGPDRNVEPLRGPPQQIKSLPGDVYPVKMPAAQRAILTGEQLWWPFDKGW